MGYSRLTGVLAEGKAMIEEMPESQRSYSQQALYNMTETDMMGLLNAQGRDEAHANITDALLGASSIRRGTSSLAIDKEKYISLQEQLKSGEISMNDVQKMYTANIDALGGSQKFLPAFEVASAAFNASNPDLAANAGFAGMRARVNEILKTEGISIEEFERMSDEDKAQYWATAGMASGYTATQGLQLYELSKVATSENYSSEGFRQFMQRGVDEAKNDAWIFGDYNVPEYLKKPKVNELYDYADLKNMDTYDAKRFQKQREQVSNTLLFGMLDGKTANDYQNELSLNNILSSPTANAESDMRIVGKAFMTEDVDRMAMALKAAGMGDIAAELKKAREEGASQQVFTELGIKAVEKTEEGIKKGAGKSAESAAKVKDMEETVGDNTTAIEELIEVIKEGFEKNTGQIKKATSFFNFGLF